MSLSFCPDLSRPAALSFPDSLLSLETTGKALAFFSFVFLSYVVEYLHAQQGLKHLRKQYAHRLAAVLRRLLSLRQTY